MLGEEADNAADENQVRRLFKRFIRKKIEHEYEKYFKKCL